MSMMAKIFWNSPARRHKPQRGYRTLIGLWIRNYKTRKSLKHLDAHRLHDIGINQRHADAESRKAFWR